MSYWIASELKDARENAGISEALMATSLEVNWRTIRRLEKGETMGRDIDRFVTQYAYLTGVQDAREFWESAMKRWRKHGSPPPFEVNVGPAAAFAEAIRAEALRRKTDDQARPGRRRATP